MDCVETAMAAGQAEGTLGLFSPRVVAVTLKAALDGLLAQLAIEPDLGNPPRLIQPNERWLF